MNTSFQALIRLIDDPDEQVFAHVKEQLSQLGSSAIPILETSMEDDYSVLFQHRVEHLIKEIQFEETKNALEKWIESDEKDLLNGALIIAQYQYPSIDHQKITNLVKELKNAVWLELSHGNTSYEKVAIINKVLFEHYNFQGNTQSYHSPINSYINTVLELKIGNPLSLSIIYSIVAQELDIPIYGVNLPNHFVLAYMDEFHVNTFINNENKYGVLFYIDAFTEGKIIDTRDIRDFLYQMNLTPSRACFEPCSNSQILQRMLTNLMFAYKQINNLKKVEELRMLKSLFL